MSCLYLFCGPVRLWIFEIFPVPTPAKTFSSLASKAKALSRLKQRKKSVKIRKVRFGRPRLFNFTDGHRIWLRIRNTSTDLLLYIYDSHSIPYWVPSRRVTSFWSTTSYKKKFFCANYCSLIYHRGG